MVTLTGQGDNPIAAARSSYSRFDGRSIWTATWFTWSLTSWQPNNSHRKSFEIEKFSPKCDVVYIGSLSFSVFLSPQGGRKHKESCKLLGKLGLAPDKMAWFVPKQCFFCEAFPSGISFAEGPSQVDLYNMTSARKSSLAT